MTGHPPADDHPAEHVGDEADIRHPGPGRDVGQVGDPQLVGGRRGEVALDQIRVAPGARVSLGGADPFPAAYPFDAGVPHQPGDLIAAHVVTGPVCRFPQLAGPVDAVVVPPQLNQGRTQDGVTAGPL